MNTKTILTIAVGGAALLCGTGCDKEDAQQAAQAMPPVKVGVMNMVQQDVTLYQTWFGHLRGVEEADIRPEVSGRLLKQVYKDGSWCQEGDVLFQIDPASYKAAVDMAEANLEAAKASVLRAQATFEQAEQDVKRYTGLVKSGTVSEKNYTDALQVRKEAKAALTAAEAQVGQAKANLEKAKITEASKRELLNKGIISQNEYKIAQSELQTAKASLAQAQASETAARNDLSHTIICAPSDGVVGNINHRQGSLVGPNIQTPLTVVSDNSVIYAYISISEASYLTLMNEYGSKEAVMAELPKSGLIMGNGERYDKEGTVETFSGIVDQNTGAISVRIAYENPNGILAAGGSATVECPIKLDSAIIVPRTATYEIQDKVYVYRVVESEGKYTAESTIIEVVRLDEQNYIAIDGLDAGDIIVTEGVRKMTNGQEIKIDNGEEKAEKK